MVPDYLNSSKLLFYFYPHPGLRAVPAPGDALYAGTATMDALCTQSTTPRAAPEACGARARVSARKEVRLTVHIR